jgi:ABC-type uncharacterized transport system substrate-binding protein
MGMLLEATVWRAGIGELLISRREASGLEEVTVSVSIRQARNPVFTIRAREPDRGTLFDYGADFYVIGKQTGDLAARILHGANPREIPFANFVPSWLVVNKTALRDLKDPWQLPDELLKKADVMVDDAGIHTRMASKEPPPSKK